MGRQRRSRRHSGLRQDEVDGAGASGSAQVLTTTDEELNRPLIQVVISIFSYLIIFQKIMGLIWLFTISGTQLKLKENARFCPVYYSPMGDS